MRQPGQFDAWAADYEAALSEGLALTGESRAYFARGRIRDTGDRLAEIGLRPRRILDLGCGTGASSPLLQATFEGSEVVGIDPSEDSIERAAAEYSGSRVSFVVTDAYVPTGDVDLVYCNGVLHHVPIEDRPAFYAFVRAALGPKGVFALWENNPWNPGTRWVMSRIPFDHDAIPVTPRAARRALRSHGFEVLSASYLFFLPGRLSWLRPLERRLKWLALGGQYGLLARHLMG